MKPTELQAVEAKAFVPARDFELSLRFYTSLGFTTAWSERDLAELRHGNASFLLQRFFVEEHAHNFQMHLLVTCADDWHARFEAQGIETEFGIKPGEVADQPWGVRDFVFLDPSAVMWRVGQSLPKL